MTEIPPLGQRYRIDALIGEGGSALVYRAFDLHLHRAVALKVLHDYVQPQDRRRFEREMRTLSQISHPGVISIFDLGHDEVGRLYFTMQLLGSPISSLGPISDHPEQLEDFLNAFIEVCAALEHIHAVGIIHRDLTPQNILLGADGRPRIMDFGLVYLSEGTRNLTRTGYTLGTPMYMSPEQAKGLGVGPASDLYALGVVMHRTLSGRPIFEGDNDQSILYQHVYETPIAPHTLNPAIPDALSALILRLLAKNPNERPQYPQRVLQRLAQDLWRKRVPAQHRGGLSRSGYHPDGPPDPWALHLNWESKLGAELCWPAAITSNGQVLAVGHRRGAVQLLSLQGQLLHSLAACDEVTAPATFDQQQVLFGSWDGYIRSYQLDGSERWSYRSSAQITAAPLRWRELWLVPSHDGYCYALLAHNGRMIWRYHAQAALSGSGIVWHNTLIICDEHGWIHGVDAHNGQGLWKIEVGAVHATPALSPDGVLLVPCWSGELHAIQLHRHGEYAVPSSDPLLWSYDLEGELWASPAVYRNTVFTGAWSGILYALDLHTGDERWTLELGGALTASPVVSNHHVYLATESGRVLGVDIHTGLVIWQHHFDVGVQATPLVHEGVLYIGFMDGTVRAFH